MGLKIKAILPHYSCSEKGLPSPPKRILSLLNKNFKTLNILTLWHPKIEHTTIQS